MNELTKKQRLDKFVDQNIYHSVSVLIGELSSNDKYIDEISSFSSKQDIDNDNYIDALEFWLVSDWLANKLEEQGEPITKDFLGLPIWGRTCSGQAISMDDVIETIFDNLKK